jgi:hypothetical protein
MNKTERAAKIKAAVEDFHSVDPELRHLIAGSSDEVAATVSSTLPLEKLEITAPPRSMTRQEENEFEGTMLAKSILGDEGLQSVAVTEEMRERFRNGGAVSPIQRLIDDAIEKVLDAASAGHPRPTDVLRPFAKAAADETPARTAALVASLAEDEGMHRLAERVEQQAELLLEANPALVTFIAAAALGDEVKMREVVREVIAAGAKNE